MNGLNGWQMFIAGAVAMGVGLGTHWFLGLLTWTCLLYTSDAADE